MSTNPSNSKARPDNTATSSPRMRSDGSVTEATYRKLLELIDTRQLAPGEVVEERRLALQLNVSRTPLRAGISRLLGEGTLQQLSNGSVVVREVGVTELVELIHIRMILEGEAAALAARRMPVGTLDTIKDQLQEVLATAKVSKGLHWALDDEIHTQIAAHCGNRSLGRMIDETRQKIRMCNVERIPERLIPACEEHLALVEALRSRDPQRASQAMISHLTNVRLGMLQSLGILQPGLEPETSAS